MKKVSQMGLENGLSEDKIREIEETFKSSGLPQETIDEITGLLKSTYETTDTGEEIGTTNPPPPNSPEPPPTPDTGVKQVLQPGKQIGHGVITAEELMRRVSMSHRLRLCADDLEIFEEEVQTAAEYLMEEEGLDFEAAWDIAAETIHKEFTGG